jgi:hypothetical protein
VPARAAVPETGVVAPRVAAAPALDGVLPAAAALVLGEALAAPVPAALPTAEPAAVGLLLLGAAPTPEVLVGVEVAFTEGLVALVVP